VASNPLIVLFDEVDVVQEETMISFLRQLRGGFAGRGVGKFPVSVALVGMRDLYEKYRYIIEIKLLRSYHSPDAFRKKGLEQVIKYRDKFGAQTPAYLIIFDRRPESRTKSWDERISWERKCDVTVLGC
jgi:hypothetical protein